MEPDDPPPVPEDASGLLGGAELLGGLQQWAAEARADDAAAARARERWLRQQAEEEATLAGMLLDLAEAGTPVVVHTTAGRRVQGVLAAVAADFCRIHGRNGATALVAYGAVAVVRPEVGTVRPAGDRATASRVRLVEAIGALAAEHDRVLVVAGSDGEVLRGRIVAVGRDVVTLRLDGDARAVALVPVWAITEVATA